MRTTKVYHAVDSHTEGMPTRVIVGGVPPIPGATMADRRIFFQENWDHIRQLLMFEPRGHSSMSGAIVQPPTRPDADYGVLYIEVSGLLPMCGHGTIGVSTVLVETGMVEVVEPETLIRLDTPAGLVEARVAVSDGHANSVTIKNVPSFVDRLDATVNVPGYGEITYDLAFGGNFYAFVKTADLGITFGREHKDDLLAAGLAIMDAINEDNEPVHPERADIRGVHHVYLEAPDSTPLKSKHAMAIYPGWFDRSPCGTGTSARLAQLHARGLIGDEGEIENSSIIGSTFRGKVTEVTEVAGRTAIVPSITGRAWVTGTAQYFLDPTDPFPHGFLL